MKSQLSLSSEKPKSLKMKNSWNKIEIFCSRLARVNAIISYPGFTSRFGMPCRPSPLTSHRWLFARRRNLPFCDRRYGSYYHKGSGFKTAGRL
jgi:hypothetical protein